MNSNIHPTIVVRAVAEILDYALNRSACVLIQGRTGRGKTEAVRAWARRHRRDACCIDCPVDGGTPAIARALADAVGVADPAELKAHLSGKRCLVIIDECARLIPARGGRARALEWLRKLHDETGVALAFVATDFFMRECCQGGLGEYLEQFIGRFRDKLVIPDFVSPQECADILRPFLGEEPQEELVAWAGKVANASGRGGARRLWWLVEDAKAVADKSGRKLDLPFLRAALADYEGRDRLPVKG